MAQKISLLVIDLQKEYLSAGRPLFVRDGQAVLDRSKRLMDAARRKGIGIVHIKHVSSDPADETFNANSPWTNFAYDVPAGEPVVVKNRPGAFHSTTLDGILRAAHVETVAVLGLLSFMCCDTTAREAHARGYKVLFLEDATAAIPLGTSMQFLSTRWSARCRAGSSPGWSALTDLSPR